MQLFAQKIGDEIKVLTTRAQADTDNLLHGVGLKILQGANFFTKSIRAIPICANNTHIGQRRTGTKNQPKHTN
jgi:hypothetical protein